MFLYENTTDAKCMYTIDGVESINGHTDFVFTHLSTVPSHQAFFLDGNSNLEYK